MKRRTIFLFRSVVIYAFISPSGNVYIGKHYVDEGAWEAKGSGSLPDGYLGSGEYIKRAHRKHGDKMKWRILFFCSPAHANKSELRAIKLARNSFGIKCKNIKDGGDGFTSQDMRANWANPEYAEKNKASVRAAHTRDDVKLKFKNAAKKRWECAVYRAKHKEGLMAAMRNPQSPMAKGLTERWSDQKAREAASEKVKDWWSDPSVKLKMSEINKAAQGRPEVREAARITQKRVQNLPEVKARQIAGVLNAWSDPEKKAERLAKRAATIAKRKDAEK